MTEQYEKWEDIPVVGQRQILILGGKLWSDAIKRLGLRKIALELAVAAVGAQGPGESACATVTKIDAVADRLLAWLEKDKLKIEPEDKSG